jgi:putative ABC transport system substrate-binding protein
MLDVRRREFITLLGGTAAWPLAARAQQPAMPVIGFLSGRSQEEAAGDTAAFRRGLSEMGFVEGRNLAIEYRWAEGRNEQLLASGGTTLGPLRQVSRTVPTVFTGVGDPVGAGFVDSLARPGGNATGFIAFEWSVSGKWLELLKEIAPGVTRAVVLRDSELGSGASQFAVIQAVAPSLRGRGQPGQCGRRC